jgi:hypothetical protein
MGISQGQRLSQSTWSQGNINREHDEWFEDGFM